MLKYSLLFVWLGGSLIGRTSDSGSEGRGSSPRLPIGGVSEWSKERGWKPRAE